ARADSPHEAASQTAGSGSQFEDRSRSFQFDKTRQSVGEMEATRVRRCYLQRLLQPKAKENWRIRRHPIIHPNRDLRIILAVVCYSFSNPTCGGEGKEGDPV